MRHIFLCLLACSFLLPGKTQASPDDSKPASQAFSHYLSRDEKGMEKSQTFTLSDKVYLHIQFSHLPKGNHRLKALWFSPKGKLQEKTDFPISLSQSQSYQAYLWLSFESRGWLSKLQSRSLSMPEFMGEWRVELYLNQQKLLEDRFSVQ